MKGLKVPCKGLIGPWSHKYPHAGKPGPAIGWLQECLRWWDRWLKGIENGIMQEPMLRVFMQDSVPPFTHYEDRPGRWVSESDWPSANIRDKIFYLSLRHLSESKPDDGQQDLKIESPLRTGMYAGKWCSYSAPPDLPSDQREDDGGALVFDTDPLKHDIEILGSPVVTLDVSADKPVAMLAVRLSDVLPNGDITRTTYGLLNLTHRNSHEHPEPLEPGTKYTVQIRLNHVSQRFPAGHQIRLSVSSVYWPLAWPAPQPVELTIHPAENTLTLPVRDPKESDKKFRPFEDPETAPSGEWTELEPMNQGWKVERDLANDKASLIVKKNEGRILYKDIQLQHQSTALETYTIYDNDLDSVHGETHWEQEFCRDDWKARSVTKTVLKSDEKYFYINADLDAFEGEKRIFCRSWNRKIRRDLV
jgi:hypothetical protein